MYSFLAKIRKFKMAANFGQKKNFWKLGRLYSFDTLWVENFDEIAISLTVKEIEEVKKFSDPNLAFKWPPLAL